MPLVSQTFDQLISFTRTSAATFVGSNGLVQVTPASKNILTFTQEFDNVAWTKTSVTVAANSTVAPDTTSTADTVTATAVLGTHAVYLAGTNLAGATQWTASVYAKVGTYGFMQIMHSSNSDYFADFNLTTGVVGTVGVGVTSTAITAVGNGWYRCSITFTPGAPGTIRFNVVSSASAVYNESWTPAGTETFFLWGAQAEIAAAPTTYTRNFGGLYPPRFDYDPVSLAPRGLLVEQQSTNLMIYSEQFDNAAWNKGDVTVTANATTSPDGTSNADTLVENTATTPHRIIAAAGFSIVSGTSYTASIFAKNAGRRYLNLNWSAAFNARATFDLQTGTVSNTASGTATITDFGNGWYRCTVTNAATVTATANGYFQLSNSSTGTDTYTGDGTSGLHIWGAQLEALPFASNYIPTVASQVTRTTDTANISAPVFAPWYNQSEGTLVAEYSSFATTASTSKTVAAPYDGTANNRLMMYLFIDAPAFTATVGGVSQALLATAGVTANSVVKSAAAYRTNDFAFSTNGSVPVTDTSGSLPVTNALALGSLAGSIPLNGHLRRIVFYPTRLTDAQLQALTL